MPRPRPSQTQSQHSVCHTDRPIRSLRARAKEQMGANCHDRNLNGWLEGEGGEGRGERGVLLLKEKPRHIGMCLDLIGLENIYRNIYMYIFLYIYIRISICLYICVYIN